MLGHTQLSSYTHFTKQFLTFHPVLSSAHPSDIHTCTSKLCDIFSFKIGKTLLKQVFLAVSCLAREWLIVLFNHNSKQRAARHLILWSSWSPHCFRIRQLNRQSEIVCMSLILKQPEQIPGLYVLRMIFSHSVEWIRTSHVTFNKKG